MTAGDAAQGRPERGGRDIDAGSAWQGSRYIRHLGRAPRGLSWNHDRAAVIIARRHDAVIHLLANYVAKGAQLVAKDQVVAVGHPQVQVAIGMHPAGEAEIWTAAKEEIGIGEHAELKNRN